MIKTYRDNPDFFLKAACGCATAMENKKAEAIQLLDVRGKTLIADFFLMCSCSSKPQVKAVHTDIRKRLKKEGLVFLGEEGTPESGWILIDCSEVIIHIFTKPLYDYYNIEAAWPEAVSIDWKGENETHQKHSRKRSK